MKKVKKNLVARTVIIILLVFIAAISVYWTKTQKEKPVCSRCNVVLVDIDILRADALPCYGYSRNTAPSICALAQKSQFFIDNYAQSNWTLPSFISTITSLYPLSHGVQKTYKDELRPNVPTLAQTLKNFGYKTYFFGPKTPSVMNDTNGGTKGYDVTQNIDVDRWAETLRGLLASEQRFFAHFYSIDLHMPYRLKSESQIIEKMERPVGFPITHEEFSSLVSKYLYQNYKEVFTPTAIKERPDIFTPTGPSSAKSLADYYWRLIETPDATKITDVGWPAQYDTYLKEIKKDEQKTRPYVRLLYDSVLALIDKKIAPSLEAILSKDIPAQTLIVFYSDHGEEFGERGRYGHPYSLYNEIIKTPLLIYVPGVKPHAITGVSENIDIFPTILSLVGVRPPLGIQGSSLLPFITNNDLRNQSVAISQANTNMFSIYNGTWKLIINNISAPQKDAELYNTTNDYGEKNNVFSSSPDVGNALLTELLSKISSK